MIIHTHFKKLKPKKPNAKQRELKASWQAILDKYEIKNIENKGVSGRTSYSPTLPVSRSTGHIRSVDTGIGNTAKRASPVYSGDAVIGISVLHKSNAVPVFSKQDILDISKMRRG